MGNGPVLINDVHFSLKNLDLSSRALKAALDKANQLGTYLVVGGDLHDTKVNLRSECIRAMREILGTAELTPFVMVGNHDRDNEKADPHALTFLEDLVNLIWAAPHFDRNLNLYMVPYCHDQEQFKKWIEEAPSSSVPYVHQGVNGAFMGEYIIDRSSVDPSLFDRFKYGAYSGHYHRKQKVGNLTYLGNPFTQSSAEAGDGAKGFHVLGKNYQAELIELDLPRHHTIEIDVSQLSKLPRISNPADKVWLKITGPGSELKKIDKDALGQKLIGHSNYKLDRIPYEKEDTKTARKKSKGEKETTFSDLVQAEISLSQETQEVKSLLVSTFEEISG